MKQRGFTLIEVVVVLGILGILLAIGFSTTADFKQKQESESIVVNVVSLLEDARARTIGSLEDSSYGVRVTSSSASLFKGGAFATSSVIGNVVIFPSSFSVTTSLTGGGSDVIFERLTGLTAQNGTITITSIGTSTVIRIHRTGTIDTE